MSAIRMSLTLARLATAALAALVLSPAPAAALQPSDLPKCPAGTRHCIALALWLPTARAGNLSGWLGRQLDTANRLLAAIDAGVQVAEVHDLPRSDTDLATTAQRTRLGRHGQ